MGATHLAYNLMKMPGSNGVVSVSGDTGDALQALKLAFKAAAVAQPAGSVAPEPKRAAPAKKKQLFT